MIKPPIDAVGGEKHVLACMKQSWLILDILQNIACESRFQFM